MASGLRTGRPRKIIHCRSHSFVHPHPFLRRTLSLLRLQHLCRAWRSIIEPYADAVREEIRRAAEEYGRLPIQTIFIGGGTPTVLPAACLTASWQPAGKHFAVAPDAEITSEANPGTVDQAHFTALRAMGVNRLSMGVQSFDDAELKWLGRIHSAEEAEGAFDAARRGGFHQYQPGLHVRLCPTRRPTPGCAPWQRAIDLGPEHLSLYSLTVEAGTPLADRCGAVSVPRPRTTTWRPIFTSHPLSPGGSGYVQYEISNWAEDDTHQCRHNLVYWRDESYLGFGAGAHSYATGQRWWNVRPVPQYIQRMKAGRAGGIRPRDGRAPSRNGRDHDARSASGARGSE